MKHTYAFCLFILVVFGCSQTPSYTVFKEATEPISPEKTACVSPIDRSSVVVKEKGVERGPSLETAEQLRSIIVEELTSHECFAKVTKGMGASCGTFYEVQGKLALFSKEGSLTQSARGMEFVESKEEPLKIALVLSIRDIAADRIVFSAKFESGTSNVISDEEGAFREIAKNFAAALASRR
jgi:hypothetical protein